MVILHCCHWQAGNLEGSAVSLQRAIQIWLLGNIYKYKTKKIKNTSFADQGKAFKKVLSKCPSNDLKSLYK